MAGFFALGFRSFLLGGLLIVVGALPSPAAPAPAPGTTNAAATPVPPPASPPPDFSRYGKILSPSDQAPYPFKLTMPYPGVGEIKVPSKEELEVRQKLEQLAVLSDAEIRDQLEKWPAFSKMSLGDEGAFLSRIQQFRDYHAKVALEKAHKLGLVTLNPVQQARFEKEYWNKRLKMDLQLSQQLEPMVKNAGQKLNEDLYREFSSTGALAQAPKPPGNPPVPPQPPVPVKPPPVAAAH